MGPIPSQDPQERQGPDSGPGWGGPDLPGHGTHLPGMGQAADGRVAETKHDGKEGIKILLLLEAVSRRPRDPQGRQPHTEPQTHTTPQATAQDPARPALSLQGLGLYGMGKQGPRGPQAGMRVGDLATP